MNSKLTVVIPTLGRPILLKTLKSLVSAEGADLIEIIVAGRIADEKIMSEIRKLETGSTLLKMLDVSYQSGDSSRKKNAGISESSGEIVAFIDDDVIVAHDWPLRMIEAFADDKVGIVSGPGLVPADMPLMGRLAGVALASKASGYVAERYIKGDAGIRRIKWSRIIGCNMAFRRDLLKKLVGFDPKFWPGEEMVAAYRAAEMGHGIVFHPGASVYHYPRTSFWGFMKQMYGYGATRIRLFRARLEFEPTTIVPALWVLSLLVCAAGLYLHDLFLWLLLANAGLYLLCDLVVTILKVAQTRRSCDLLMFFIVPFMHLSYGIGEWAEFFLPDKDLSH